MRERFFQKKNSGFTLVETLAAVAILVVLLGISAVAVLRLQKYLEITRLDNAARGIYMAAQNRAVLLSGGKQLKALVQGEDNAVSLAARTGEEAPLYYVAHTAEKTDPALEQLLTAGSIDPALRQGAASPTSFMWKRGWRSWRRGIFPPFTRCGAPPPGRSG